jgi:hypothetical protein
LVAINTKDGKSKFLKMTVIQSLSRKDVSYEAPLMINKSAKDITDGRR